MAVMEDPATTTVLSVNLHGPETIIVLGESMVTLQQSTGDTETSDMAQYAEQWRTREYPNNHHSIYFYLFISLAPHTNQATAELGSHECSSQNWDKMNTLCLISANPGQKLKEEEEEERLVGGPVRSQF